MELRVRNDLQHYETREDVCLFVCLAFMRSVMTELQDERKQSEGGDGK